MCAATLRSGGEVFSIDLYWWVEWQRWHSIVQNILSRGRSSCGSCLCAPHIAGEPQPTTVDISDRGVCSHLGHSVRRFNCLRGN
ncbi:hypothetical protein EPR50_G00122810 [Perca flavescens]|uniref:Uncharacterized protein n=1 Tax=Perca flavescens TaxID=8167 RepID=A0A484CTG7_PERFV|nr:hypothetical protein EPR50_G00122810 [Perca flavescens]